MMTRFHYYNHLAEEWLSGTCEDLGMSYTEGLSADIGSPRFTPSSSRASSAGIAEKKSDLRTALLTDEHDRRDGFQEFYQNLVNSCNVLVQAMNLEDRFATPIW